jgi:predicted membrane protein
MEELICWINKYQIVFNFFTSLIPIFLTIFGSYIAVQQYRVNRKRLKKDLFDKRYEIFEHTKEFLGDIVTHGLNDERKRKYILGTRGVAFIFDSDLKAYIDKIWSISVDLESWEGDVLPSTHATERAEHLKWVSQQLKVVDSRFEKYMSLSH